MVALTIGTWAPLHRSPLQQSTSHFVIFTEGLVDLQFFEPWLQSDEVVHPLAKILTVLPELSDVTSSLPQRSSPSLQFACVVVLLHSSQLLSEKHWLHFRA